MRTRRLGKSGPEVSAMGLGCMGMSEFYGKSDDSESVRVVLKALESGVTMLDTAEMYGSGHNEELIGKALKEWRGEVFVATKCGIIRQKGEYERKISNRPEYIREALEGSLRRLKRDHVDLYYLHRFDTSTPLEDSIGELSRLADEGKIRYIGLSEVSAATLEKAEKIHHITALQSEYSLFTRDVEAEILPASERLGTGFVAYSPIGRGMLSAKLNKEDFMQEGDLRQHLPRTGENFDSNLKLVKELEKIAASAGVTPSQFALAWVLSRGDHIIPIPGTRKEKHLLENIAAAELNPDTLLLKKLGEIFIPGAVQGERYTPEGMKGVEV